MWCRLLFLTFLLGGCASTSKHAVTTTSNETDSLVASIERSVCFGTCPAYKLTVYRSGLLQFEGYRNTSKTGKYFTYVNQQPLLELCEKAHSLGYFELQDQYRNEMIADLPTVTTFLRCGNRQKGVVFFDLECPQALKSVQDLIDGLAPADSMWMPTK